MPKSKGNKKPHPSYAKREERKLRMAESLNPFLKKYLAKIEAENEQMKTDPNTTIGQLIPQMREAVSQNKRLSVLAAALIESQGGSVTLSKTSLESFEGKLLNIKWSVPEGVEDVEKADTFIFTYETKEQESDAPKVTITPSDAPDEGSVVEITNAPEDGRKHSIHVEPTNDGERRTGELIEMPIQ